MEEVSMDFVYHEWSDWGHEFTCYSEYLAKCVMACRLVITFGFVPEPSPRSPNVPIGDIVNDESLYFSSRLVEVPLFKQE